MSSARDHLPVSLLLLRLGVFSVMIMWTLDKFLNPGHASRVAETFYGVAGVSPVLSYAAGVLQLAVVLAFVAGFKKQQSYGAVLVMHAVSTASTWKRMLNPWEVPNLLFFAALPMLAACVALYLLRDEDRLFCIGR